MNSAAKIGASLPALLLAMIANAHAAISPAHPELLQQGILDAYNAGQTSVVIPAGTYLIPAVSGFHLNLENLNNFEIDASGATLVFQDVTAVGIVFYNCTGVYFHGATVYYATPPFSQGVVQAVASDGSSADIRVEQGYPTNLDDPTYFSPGLIAHLFDATTRLWKRNANGDLYGTSTQRLGTDTFRIFTTDFGGAVGDLVGIRPGTGDTIIKVISCSLMSLSDLIILNSPFNGIVEAYGSNLGANTYTNITIQRGNRPAGAVTDPLFSVSGDGFFSIQARTGPYVTGCSFEFTPDDGMAVHGVFSWVIESSGNTLIVSDTAAVQSNFQPGDTLQLLDANDDPAGNAIVTGVTLLPGYTNPMKSARQTIRDFTVGPYYQITLDRTVTAGFDYLASNPNASGAGFVILNNTIRNHRARGIIVKAANGTIQGNIIDGSTLDGIKVGPDFWWGEAGQVAKLLIKGNTINNVGYSGGGAAGILISPDPVPSPPGAVIQNVTIDGNTFSNFDVPAIFLSSASGVTITNNVFTNLQNAIPFNPNYLGQNVIPGTLVFIGQSTGVQFHGNTVSQPGPVNAWFAEALSGSGVSGAAYVTPVASSDTDFSGTQGASNWNYGYFPSGNINAFALLPVFDTTNARWQHTTFGPPWTALWSYSGFFPNPADSGVEEWATRRWTSNFSGPAAITGHLAKTDTSSNSTGIYGRIYLNQALVYQQFIQGTDGTGVDYSVGVQLHKGDTVDFSVAPNGAEGYNDATQFTSSILSITLVNQTIAFTQPANVTVTTPPFSLSATASSGLPVSFVSNTLSVCTVSGSTVTIIASGGCSVTASQAGNANYAAATSVTQSFTVVLPVYHLATAVSPSNSGTITISPAATGNNYASGSTVCLTASPGAGQVFVGWTGSALIAAGCLTVNASVSVTANFQTNPIPASSALRFVPVAPCRLVDTRNANGPLGGPSVGAGATRSFTIPGTCNIPSTALAYSLNLTVVPQGLLGYVTTWPTGQSQPVVSTLNSLDGRVKSNAAIVPAGTSGAVSVFATNSTDVILDINGYFDSYTDSSALQFYPLTPCRVADTRNSTGSLGGPSLLASQSRSFPIMSSACNIPANALAYSLNFTAIPQVPLGYLTVWPSGQSQPLVSTLNAPTAAVTANAAIVPVGTGGAIELFVTNNTDMAIDINGYFAAPASGGLSLYNLTPCRIEDTRLPAGTPAFTGTVTETATGVACGVPSEAQSLVLNATVVPSGVLGYLSLWASGGSQPVVSTLNSLDGSVTSNMAVVPTTNGLVNAYAAGPAATYLILDISGYFAP